MTVPFNPQQRLIVVTAELEGPTGSVILQLALATKAKNHPTFMFAPGAVKRSSGLILSSLQSTTVSMGEN